MRATYSRSAAAAGLGLCLLLGASRGPADHRPLDGGSPLQRAYPGDDEILVKDRYWRRERGLWHSSVGHFEEMLPPERVSGIWIRSYEISSFFPGAETLSDIDPEARDRFALEIDADRVDEMIGRDTEGSDHHLIALSLVARRTRYPWVDCYGDRQYVFVAYEIEQARYLLTTGYRGPPINPAAPPGPPWEPFEPSGEGGVTGQREREALAQCAARTRPAGQRPSRVPAKAGTQDARTPP